MKPKDLRTWKEDTVNLINYHHSIAEYLSKFGERDLDIDVSVCSHFNEISGGTTFIFCYVTPNKEKITIEKTFYKDNYE